MGFSKEYCWSHKSKALWLKMSEIFWRGFFRGFLIGGFIFGIIGIGVRSYTDTPCAPIPPAPRLISCTEQTMMILDPDKGPWPQGGVTGCRCLYEYEGEILISRHIKMGNSNVCRLSDQ